MTTYWYLWAFALCVTGFLFWLAFRLWLNSDEARGIYREQLQEQLDHDWMVWGYEFEFDEE